MDGLRELKNFKGWEDNKETMSKIDEKNHNISELNHPIVVTSVNNDKLNYINDANISVDTMCSCSCVNCNKGSCVNCLYNYVHQKQGNQEYGKNLYNVKPMWVCDENALESRDKSIYPTYMSTQGLLIQNCKPDPIVSKIGSMGPFLHCTEHKNMRHASST